VATVSGHSTHVADTLDPDQQAAEDIGGLFLPLLATAQRGLYVT
jgi:hypothetical protein